MKKILSLFTILSLFFVGCSSDGEVGPPGPPGPPGEDGVNILGTSFEINGVDFTNPDYSIYSEIPSEIEVYPTDVLLVYWQEGETEDGTPFWNLLPQTFYTENGEWQYNYNYTDFDVNIYIQSEFDKNLIDNEYLTGQNFKVVILPVDDYQNAQVNYDNFNEVQDYFKLK